MMEFGHDTRQEARWIQQKKSLQGFALQQEERFVLSSCILKDTLRIGKESGMYGPRETFLEVRQKGLAFLSTQQQQRG